MTETDEARDDRSASDEAELAGLRRDAIALLESVRTSVRTLLDGVKDDAASHPDVRELTARTAEYEKAIRIYLEIQTRLDELFAKHARVIAAYEIDFDAVRHDIGCRLARIRECCAEGDVPGDPD
ncbi:hypothetical protein [Wenxinia marina]|uniref:Uncharacterized protein n=1 Tax=Wenxinia marina DSM 24838 TaxID=1123501 RepID=A0A0D0Q649_9RHOB|nr:hypothetical protein [Wenxinia marina]KIQ69944.1 hypothetical protein Wenmar_01514 [Wenxinia marina DSM 24838]GGL62354.1 hypothetical protein GCM10011392_16180 [Wenxinia marina]